MCDDACVDVCSLPVVLSDFCGFCLVVVLLVLGYPVEFVCVVLVVVGLRFEGVSK